jgi:RNA polymerase sigma factor (sigma-70 family)
MKTNSNLTETESQEPSRTPVVSEWESYTQQHAWLARRLVAGGCHKQDAEDVAQEALFKACLRKREGRDLQREQGWLLVVARNIARDRVRRSHPFERNAVQFENIDQVDHSASLVEEKRPETCAERASSLLRKMFEAYCSLRDRDRVVLCAWCLTGGDTGRAAKALGLRRRAIKVCIFRARQRLQRRLVRSGGEDQLLGLDQMLRLTRRVQAPSREDAHGVGGLQCADG